MPSHPAQSHRRKRHVMAAVVLGTALSTLGASPLQARQNLDIEPRAVHDISRYCMTCWKNARLPADCWSDCTQEVFGRLLQSLPQDSWNSVFKSEGAERQEFVRAIDAVKKRTQRQLKKVNHFEGVVADHRSIRESQRLDERETVRRAAEELLSDRQQRILQMSMEGWAVQDIADELDMGPERVSDEKYKAVQKLRKHLKSH